MPSIVVKCGFGDPSVGEADIYKKSLGSAVFEHTVSSYHIFSGFNPIIGHAKRKKQAEKCLPTCKRIRKHS